MKDGIRKWLTEQFGKDVALHDELYGQYAADMKSFMSELDASLAVGDMEKSAAVAHTMKGMALQMGDGETAGLSKALQCAIQTGDGATWGGIVPQVRELVAAL